MKIAPVFDLEINDHFVRMVDYDNSVWFVIVDVLDAMCVHENIRAAILDQLKDCDTCLTLVEESGRPEPIAIISESGLCDLVAISEEPEAAPMKEWVTRNFLR